MFTVATLPSGLEQTDPKTAQVMLENKTDMVGWDP